MSFAGSKVGFIFDTDSTPTAFLANPGGATGFTTAWILINSGFDSHNSCYVNYNRSANALYRMNHVSSAWLSPVALEPCETAVYSKCGQIQRGIGRQHILALNAALTFQSAFAGNRWRRMPCWQRYRRS